MWYTMKKYMLCKIIEQGKEAGDADSWLQF